MGMRCFEIVRTRPQVTLVYPSDLER